MYEKWSGQEAIERLNSHEQTGLSEQEASRRLLKNGKNEMRESRHKSAPERFVEQLNDPLIYVLIVAAFFSVMLKEVSDSVIIGIVVFINALVGMVQEGKAQKALDSLRQMTQPKALVIRDGSRKEIPAAELVPGDLVCLETGCQVPADIRLLDSVNLQIEESALTGEALPVEKDARFLVGCSREIPLGDRRNMAYLSTLVSYGRGMGIVVATGMDTEIGKIADMISSEKEEMTPLQKRLGELGKILSIISLLLCMALFGVAILQKRNPFEMLLTAISLAVAAVPEGLPAVVTICLALSVTRMVKVHTIVRRLPSVETLGAVNVVCSDKTGTLTQNRMTIATVYPPEKTSVSDKNLLLGMVLCNDAAIEGKRMGDPTELALLDYAVDRGFRKTVWENRMPRQEEIPFDSDRKMMTTFHYRAENHQGVSYTKGAPDALLKQCTRMLVGGREMPFTEREKKRVEDAIASMASRALRTLAFAMKENVSGPVEKGLVFLGVVGMQDPVRPEAAEAVRTFQQAGVDTVMITGDHVDTAFAIGKQLHIVEQFEQCMSGENMDGLSETEFRNRLDDTRIFARVSPAQKVRIVKGFKAKGKIVAMTGDGVNDAPSLKAADIGIAMGMMGTDVAKQASDMILTDDNFATIEKAIEEGRGVYENIRKSIIFLLSSNLGEILTMFVAVLCGLSSPLKSSHILWINLITDSLPALALGVDRNDPDSLMRQSPRKKEESLFARGGMLCTCLYGLLIAAISLTAFLLLPWTLLHSGGNSFHIEEAAALLEKDWVLAKSQTYAFTVLGMSQLYHAVGMRDVQTSFFRMRWNNKLMILACVIGFILQFAVTEVPFLIRAFGTSHLSVREWGVLSLLAAFPLLTHEVIVLFCHK